MVREIWLWARPGVPSSATPSARRRMRPAASYTHRSATASIWPDFLRTDFIDLCSDQGVKGHSAFQGSARELK